MLYVLREQNILESIVHIAQLPLSVNNEQSKYISATGNAIINLFLMR